MDIYRSAPIQTAFKNKVIFIANTLGIISGIIVVLMTFFMTVDVIFRYAFGGSIPGGYEFASFMLVTVVFLSLAYTEIRNGHISISVISTHFPKSARDVIAACSNILSFCLFGVMGWMSIVQGLRWQAENQITQTLKLPMFPFAFLISFSCFVFCLVVVFKISDSLAQVTKGGWKSITGLLFGTLLVLSIISFPLWFPVKMSLNTTAIVGLTIMVALIFLNVPIAFALIGVGFIGLSQLTSIETGLNLVGLKPFSVCFSYDLSVIPLFVLMGMYAFYSGLGRDLYDAVYRWLGHLPGGLAIATIGACGGFSAICGSTIATAATMGVVAAPEMKRHRYDPALATGSLAAGGTLGILIPPSTIFVLYGVITQQSIGRLFMAGILPGILLIILFMAGIYVMCKNNPCYGVPGIRSTYKEKFKSLTNLWAILILFALVIGGIYMGIFTPTEGAGVGAFGTFLFLITKKRLNRESFIGSMKETIETTSMTMMIVVGGMMVGTFVGMTGAPTNLLGFVASIELNRYIIFGLILLGYIGLGCIIDSITILILVMPIIFPILMNLGFDPIWFGVIIVLATEIGVITPPVGVNVFVIGGVVKDVRLNTIFKGIFPFFIEMLVCVVILTAFPQIVLYLPNLLYD